MPAGLQNLGQKRRERKQKGRRANEKERERGSYEDGRKWSEANNNQNAGRIAKDRHVNKERGRTR